MKKRIASSTNDNGLFEAENCQPRNMHVHRSPQSKSIKLDEVIAQHNAICQYCNSELKRSNVAVDHEIPKRFATDGFRSTTNKHNNMLSCKACKRKHKGRGFDRHVLAQNNNGKNRMFTRSMKH